MLESRDNGRAQGGSVHENLDTQVVGGTLQAPVLVAFSVDEIVRFERRGYGTMFVFQAECDRGGSMKDWNVTAAASYAAVVLDRLHTTPYGEPTFDTYTINGDYGERSERPQAATGKASTTRASGLRACPKRGSRTRASGGGDGDLDASDDSNLTTCKNGTQPVTGACRVFDFDNDGDVDASDELRFDELYPGTGTTITRQPARRTSANGLTFAHQGLMLDEETRLYHNRHRQYDPWHKRFVQRNPLGALSNVDPKELYDEGINLYSYV